MNVEKQEIPSFDDSKVVLFGMSTLFVLVLIVGGWMGTAPLTSSSVAEGSVSADGDKKTVQHLEGGKITAIHVKDGDLVTKGQVLIKLRDVHRKAQLDILQSDYQDAIALLSRLEAQKDAKSSIVFSKDLTDENAIKDQKNIFTTTLKSIENEKLITKKRIVQLKNQILGNKALIKSKEKRLASMKEEQLEWEELFKQRLVDKQKIRELKRDKHRFIGEIASLDSDIAKLQEQINETKAQQVLSEKRFQKETLQEYVETKSKISSIQSKIIAEEDIIDRTSIRSPIDGTVVGLDLHTVGGVVTRSKTLLKIIPTNAKLLVIVNVETTDIDKVKNGLNAEIMFSAFNLKKVHVIKGNVVHVSADSFKDKKTGKPYYIAKIEVNEEGKKTLDKNGFVLVSGMPAQAVIILGDRTVLSYLVNPFTQMLGKSFNEE